MREDWTTAKYKSFLDYIQPTNYLVSSTAYDDSYKTPVLTAGKTFILGYTNEEEGIFTDTPVIIFDDFTTASKYVNFDFKAKSSAMKILKPTSDLVNLKYIYYSMQQNQINTDTHKRYWISIYAEHELLVPPLLEQKAIVAKIEQLFSELDNGIENLKTAQAKLKIYRQAVLKKAFEGVLTKEWREKQTNLPTAYELLEQIKKEREEYFKQQLEEWKQAVKEWEENGKVAKRPTKPKKTPIPEITNNSLYPNNWIEGTMECVADAIDPQPSHRTPPKVDNGIPYIGISEIDKVTGEINFEKSRKVSTIVLDEHIARYKLIEDDFVIGKIGTIGKPFFIPTERFFTLSANVVLVQPLRTISNPKYLYYLSKSPIIENQFKTGSKATTQAAFGIKKVRLLEIPLCSLKEQNQIVQEIESRLSVCDKIEETIKISLAKAEALRQSILKKAYEGKLLSEQELENIKNDPEYESAEELLKRIKNERDK